MFLCPARRCQELNVGPPACQVDALPWSFGPYVKKWIGKAWRPSEIDLRREETQFGAYIWKPNLERSVCAAARGVRRRRDPSGDPGILWAVRERPVAQNLCYCGSQSGLIWVPRGWGPMCIWAGDGQSSLVAQDEGSEGTEPQGISERRKPCGT